MSAPNGKTFHCAICEEDSTEICAWCTKDTCNLHLCEKCKRCADCCLCEIRRTDANGVHASA